MSRIKGITVWEQYAEYFALGLATLALIVFGALQLIGEPNAVEIPGHGTVTPSNVDEKLVEAAQRIDAMLRPEASPRLEIGDPQPILPEFEQALAGRVSPSEELRALVISIPLTPGESVRVGETFTVPQIPAPTAAIARQYFDTLAEEAVDEHGLSDQFPGPPFDATWITAAAAIDLDTIVESYSYTGPDGSLAPVPTSWHANLATILDVRVEREELVDGQWGSRTVVDPLRGQPSYRESIEAGVDATGRESIVRTARDLEAQRALAQPPFYPTRNSAFIPPDPLEPEIEITPAIDDATARDLRRLRHLERDLADRKRRLDALGGPLDDEVPAPPRPGGGTGGGGSAPGGGGPGLGGSSGGGAPPPSIPGSSPGLGGHSTGSGGAGQAERDRIARRNLTQQITRLEHEIEVLRTRLDLQEEASSGETEDDGVLVVWAHDVNVQPGRTYRYRVVVDIYNPFYLRRMNLVDEQQNLAELMVFSSPAGEWSKPIMARAPLHPFIVSAYAPGQDRGTAGPTLGHAVAEVFRFHDGRWWQTRFTLEPGQRVGAVREEAGQRIDFGTEWYVLDIIEDVQSDGGAQGPGREGRAARVVLQSLYSGEIMELRHPEGDLSDPVRLRLLEEIRFADAG